MPPTSKRNAVAAVAAQGRGSRGRRNRTNSHSSLFKEAHHHNRAQKLYAKLCNGKKSVRPDHDLMRALKHHVLAAGVEGYGKAELEICGQIISKVTNLEGVRFWIGQEYAGVSSVPTTARGGKSRNATSGREPQALASGATLKIMRTICRRLSPAAAAAEDEAARQRHLQQQALKSGASQSLAVPNASELVRAASTLASIHNPLVHLELPGVKLSVDACKILSRGLHENTGLQRLLLDNCSIGDDGLHALAPGLRTSRVNDLSVSRCRLSDIGGSLLCSIVKAHSARRNDERWAATLRQHARPDPETVRNNERVCAEVQLCGIVALNASNNALTDLTASQMASALAHDTWVVALNLRGNLISTVGTNEVKNRLETNEALAAVDLQSRTAQEAAEEELRARAEADEKAGTDKSKRGKKNSKSGTLKSTLGSTSASSDFGDWDSTLGTTAGASAAAIAAAAAAAAEAEAAETGTRCYRPHYAFSKPGSVGMCHPAVATAVVRWGWPDPNDERVEWMRTHVASVPSVGAALSGAAFSQLASTSEQDDFHVMPSVDISLSSTAPARMGATLVSEEEADNYHEDAAIERVKQKKGHKKKSARNKKREVEMESLRSQVELLRKENAELKGRLKGMELIQAKSGAGKVGPAGSADADAIVEAAAGETLEELEGWVDSLNKVADKLESKRDQAAAAAAAAAAASDALAAEAEQKEKEKKKKKKKKKKNVATKKKVAAASEDEGDDAVRAQVNSRLKEMFGLAREDTET